MIDPLARSQISLVLLPGMDGTGVLFAPLIAALGPDYRVVVVTYPTHEPLGYEALLPIARAALPEDGPFILLGESFSGPIAIALAAERPAQLRALVLCCTFVRNPRPWLGGLRTLMGLLSFGPPPVGALSFALLGRFATAALREALARAVASVSPATMRARLRAVINVDVSAQLQQVDVPCLYLRAAHDRLVPAAAARLMASLQPAVRIETIDAPHCLLQVAPNAAASVVSTFIARLEAPT
ncbi:MAG: alpha/beta hydrolase [Pseudomonadota bacterium]